MFNQKIFDDEIAKGADFDTAFAIAIEELRKLAYEQFIREEVLKRKNELCEIAAEAYALWQLEEFKDEINPASREDFVTLAKEDIYLIRDIIRERTQES